jgi:hypothetical protein
VYFCLPHVNLIRNVSGYVIRIEGVAVNALDELSKRYRFTQVKSFVYLIFFLNSEQQHIICNNGFDFFFLNKIMMDGGIFDTRLIVQTYRDTK